MPSYLKQALRQSPHSVENEDLTTTVQNILKEIELEGETKVLEYATKFDNFKGGSIVLSAEQIAAAVDSVPDQLKSDILFAHRNIKRFAELQRSCIQDAEIEMTPGFKVGQKCIPLQCCGCYVPGGRFSHIASALMTVTTAKVAGVKRIVVCSPPSSEGAVHPAIVYAAVLCGADAILAIGGVQAIATMANGLFGFPKADIIIGPGNQYVAEAKRLLFGRVGIDQLAGPTDSLVIGDCRADANLVAADLVGQAEHGYNSPVWLVTDDIELGSKVLNLIPTLIDSLPESNATQARLAWRDYGEIIICSSREEMLEVANAYAPEHLHVQAEDLLWWLENLQNYGSLFLGEETTVPYGDKAAGPNHCLPTSRAARYTGGLSVHKFLKIVTWQQCTREASLDVALVSARISRAEGMEGHARCSDVRMAKYFPEKTAELDRELHPSPL